MASATTPSQKKCGICSKPIIAGYFTYGDYCGTTVCMQCMFKNTWSMCRMCNGTMLDYSHVPTTVTDSELESKTPQEILDTYTEVSCRVRQEHDRITSIRKFARMISDSARLAEAKLDTKLYELRKMGIEKYVEYGRRAIDARVFKLFKLISLPTLEKSEPKALS